MQRKTIQVVLDSKLLQKMDRAVQSTKRSRSMLIQDAIREYLAHLETRTLEQRDRDGYLNHPQLSRAAPAAWPAE